MPSPVHQQVCARASAGGATWRMGEGRLHVHSDWHSLSSSSTSTTHLGLGGTIGDVVLWGQTYALGNLGDRQRLQGLRDLDVTGDRVPHQEPLCHPQASKNPARPNGTELTGGVPVR